jgi:elongation factor Ts
MAITAQMIKELRDRTGVGMGKCKEALEEASGDMEKAIDILRKAGMASAVKKEGRETKEGMILSTQKGNTYAIVEVNAETDFVVRNDRFQEFLQNIANEVAATHPESLENFLKQKFSKDTGLTIDEYRATIVQAIGENIQIKRIQTFEKGPNHSVGIYSHLGGKIITVVEITGSGEEEQLAKDIAMHVAAAAPDFVSPKDVPNDIIEREKEIVKHQIQGKPANVVDKIVEGKLNAFYDGACLNRQKYIRDDSMTISQLVEGHGKKKGKPLTIASFTRWSVGH